MIITLKDGSKKEYAEAKSIYDIALDISEGLARAACAAGSSCCAGCQAPPTVNCTACPARRRISCTRAAHSGGIALSSVRSGSGKNLITE